MACKHYQNRLRGKKDMTFEEMATYQAQLLLLYPVSLSRYIKVAQPDDSSDKYPSPVLNVMLISILKLSV